MKNKILLIMLLVIIVSCNNKNNNKGIFYMDSFEAIDTGYPYGSIIYKGSYDGAYHSVHDELINSDIIAVKKTKNHLLVKQKFNEGMMKKQIKDDLEAISYPIDSIKFPHQKIAKKALINLSYYDKKTGEFDSIKLTRILDSITQNESYYKKRRIYPYNYYIIDLKSEEVSNPLSEQLFKKKIKEFKISEEDISKLIKEL